MLMTYNPTHFYGFIEGSLFILSTEPKKRVLGHNTLEPVKIVLKRLFKNLVAIYVYKALQVDINMWTIYEIVAFVSAKE